MFRILPHKFGAKARPEGPCGNGWDGLLPQPAPACQDLRQRPRRPHTGEESSSILPRLPWISQSLSSRYPCPMLPGGCASNTVSHADVSDPSSYITHRPTSSWRPVALLTTGGGSFKRSATGSPCFHLPTWPDTVRETRPTAPTPKRCSRLPGTKTSSRSPSNPLISRPLTRCTAYAQATWPPAPPASIPSAVRSSHAPGPPLFPGQGPPRPRE